MNTLQICNICSRCKKLPSAPNKKTCQDCLDYSRRRSIRIKQEYLSLHPDEDIQYLKTISLAIKRAKDYSQLFAAARRIPVGNCKNFMKLWQEYSTKLNKWWPGSKIYGVEFGDFSGLYELYN